MPMVVMFPSTVDGSCDIQLALSMTQSGDFMVDWICDVPSCARDDVIPYRPLLSSSSPSSSLLLIAGLDSRKDIITFVVLIDRRMRPMQMNAGFFAQSLSWRMGGAEGIAEEAVNLIVCVDYVSFWWVAGCCPTWQH